MLADFKKLPIWKQFDKDKSVKFDLDDLFEGALSLLDRYYKAFPTYTLHNRRHQYNILKLIGDLLGQKVKDLNKLECAILILSAAYHDIGMVFKDEEIAGIAQEESFNAFLNDNFKAKLEFHEHGCMVSKGMAEWYCRWMHAKRVWLFLDDLDKVKWKTRSLKKTVGWVCESHNIEAKAIDVDGFFPAEFKNEADVKFCAVLLRLADIMDFDNSRTPLSVYEFLDLDNPKNRNEKISKEEWEKHLCSEGFTITRTNGNTEISFHAGPEHPQVEKNINTFLDVITDELIKCSSVVNHCSKQWQNFRLPVSIDRSGISSENYKKGDYRLSLDEGQIINLLVGENLYDNPFVFIRELLQNAIDTSRMREYHEESNGNIGFKAEPIQVNTWVDENGYRWVRMDDYGMGMSEYVIKNHVLRKGASFYQSDFFRIQKLHYKEKTKKDFTPISRFGIGLLSCFILGDVLEISTRSVKTTETGSEEEKIRLSLEGLQSQYFMQAEAEKHTPLDMPQAHKNEKGYRKEYGTSIAVRVSRSKDDADFERRFEQEINKHILCSPVDVYYAGKKAGLDFDRTLNEPKAEYGFYPITEKNKKKIEKKIGINIHSEIGLEIIPLDVSRKSATKQLKGQVVIIRVKCEKLEIPTLKDNEEIMFNLLANDTRSLLLEVERYHLNDYRNITVPLISSDYRVNDFFFDQLLKVVKRPNYSSSTIDIIHNGISIPNQRSTETPFSIRSIQPEFDSKLTLHSHCYGIVYLEDELIPQLSVARNLVKSLDFNIVSKLYFATKKLNQFTSVDNYYDFLLIRNTSFSFAEIKCNDLIKEGKWNNEELIMLDEKYVSVNSLRLLITNKGSQEIGTIFTGNFLGPLTAALLELNFELQLAHTTGSILIKKIRTFPVATIDVLPPLSFITFKSDDLLGYKRKSPRYRFNIKAHYINSNHWLGRWMIVHQVELLRDFNGYFYNLIRCIEKQEIDVINNILDHFRKSFSPLNVPPMRSISAKEFFAVEDEDEDEDEW